MTLAATVFKKSTFQIFTNLNALESKLDLDVKKVNLGSSFQQTWLAPHPKCYIPSAKVINYLVLEMENFNGFLPYMGMLASWACDQNNLYKFWLNYQKESSYEI